MISNNSTYKLRASRSSREVQDYEYGNSDDNYDNIVEESNDTNKRNTNFLRDTRSSKGIGRTRSTEFRSKASDRRGYRSKGLGPPSRKSDRDYSDTFYNIRKYDAKNSESVGGTRSKFYETEKKTEIKLNLPEDTRISKLLRRLSNETDQDNSLAISKKLLEVLLIPDNAYYIRKAFHILGESMFEILHVSPGPMAKKEAARALGRMGYIMGQENDYERFLNWLFNKMNNSYDEIQILLMKSIQETFKLEEEKPVLQGYIESIINNLVTAIESIENADVFKAILEVLVTIVEMYQTEFYDQFRDTIDLLFGWHVDHTQPLGNIEFISKSLQRISHHFKYNVEFSVQLIENFLEDISNYAAQLVETGDLSSLEHVTVLILAMNTVLKCLGTSFHPTNNKIVKVEFINSTLAKIIGTVTETLESYVPDNLTIAGNDCISILLGYLDNKSQNLCHLIYKLIDLEISMLQDLSESTIISLLVFISKAVKELSANLPLELIEKLIGPKSEVLKLRYSPFKNIQDAVICVYQALLNLKNVSLLQEAYRYVLGDLEMGYKKIVPDIQSFTQSNPFAEYIGQDAEHTVLFLLRCLSQLANASSIIVMWALKPSILELVGIHMIPFDQNLASKSPALQYCLIYLLFSHCKCYNYFISNSSLVNNKQEITNLKNRFALTEGLNINDVPNTSPNSGNFAIILDVLHKSLCTNTSADVTLLLLQWLNDVLNNSEMYLENLYINEKFLKLVDALVHCGYNFNEKIVLSVHYNLDKLLSNKQLSWSNLFLACVSDLCKLHMNSNKQLIRECYSRLSSNIPWDIAIVELNSINSIYTMKTKSTTLKDYNNYNVYLAQHLHLNGTVDGEIYPLHFKTLMSYLLKNEPLDSTWMEDIFTCCWAIESEPQMNMELFYELALNNRQVLYNWITLEAAEFCVNYKLRTPLGKPNETFMKIEGALNQLGNDLITVKKVDRKADNVPMGNRVRMLLRFVEHLEKSIYNASEGCAIAMVPASKVVRSFFIANMNTCNEWFCRIRIVIMHIALHCGEVNIALRNGQCFLKDYVSLGKTNNVEFERVAMIITLAYLHLKEPEALYGLYTWCKTTTGKRYSWIKCAAEQASKKYELAVEGYKNILEERGDSESIDKYKKLDVDIQNFIMDQIIICYKELSNWIDLFDWHSKQGNIENGRKYWFNVTDWECNKVLCEMESKNLAFTELATWNNEENSNAWSIYEKLSNTESNLYNIALKLAISKDDHCILKIDENMLIIQNTIEDYLHLAPSTFLQNYSLLHYVANGLKHVAQERLANTVFLVSENFENEIPKIESSILRKILWWSEYFGKVQNQGFNIFCSNLRLDIIKRARKEKNFSMAINHIHKFFRDKDLLVGPQNSLTDVANLVILKVQDTAVWTVDIARAIFEIIKVSYAHEQDCNQTFNLCAVASTAISKNAELYGVNELRKISSKILLKLTNWMQTNENVSLMDMSSPLGKLIMVLPEIGMVENVASNIIPMNEIAIGKLLQFSVHHYGSLAKSWNIFGTWCYRWGKKIVDHSSDIKNNLSEDHCMEIKSLLPPNTAENDLTKIFLILSQTRNIIDEEDIDLNEIKTSEMIQSQLKSVKVLHNASDHQLLSLVQIWRSTQKRIYHYYALSADAYFKYLHLVLQSENITKSTECSTITVTLRLLRLIVKYALELQSILEEGLQATPTQPWKAIIPQLFSRLNHPESYVRHRVSDLLCRIAEDAPHLITFPAVVGALEGGLKFDFSEITLPKDCLSQNNESCEDNEPIEEDDNNYESDNEGQSNSLQICFKTMVDTLSKQDPETISQVQTLVKELRRITLLWDELWLGTLAQHQSEITKRQHQLEYEIEKVNENISLDKEEKASLIIEKHRIIIKPLIFILEQLLDVTSVEAETPHEKQFQEKYLDDIISVIAKLKSPDNPENPQESLQPLKYIQKKFQQKFHKRASYSLKMQDISPVLYSMKDTVIAMPGLALTKNITVSHVSNLVSVLPTKTKPKKLMFQGSDGQNYTYLFKGLEDLHLDERIMQFLSITNTMMAQIADPSGPNFYQAQHYSVIPLGPRSGLISWVDGTTPVFSLYKRWQQREIVKPSSKTAAGVNASVLRPSELFYNKLNPLLREHGVKNIDNRKEWPISVLKQVLTELMNETPSDLLSKEFWCNSISADVWWQVVKRYSYSVAVMSIIGYIIGLGDRHLDNVLVDLTSGDVVHIDYNVCFEKGKTLRVPEKVPFRLTPNIKEALGVTGVEGIFRLACENVLKTMRKGRETLLTLLEAFVYDPLIDWTVSGEVLAGTTFGGMTTDNSSKQTKKELEKEVVLSMFNVRCTEMKAEWNENKEEILNEIPILEKGLDAYLELNIEISKMEDELQDLHQQLALVKEAEAQGHGHSLYVLPSLYDTYHKNQLTVNIARKDLSGIVEDCERHIEIYNNLLASYERQQFSQWLVDIKTVSTEDNMRIFDLVKEFLHNAGKDDVVANCEQSEQEVFQLSQHINLVLRKCIQIYQDYFSIIVQCPKSYLESHRMYLYLKWSKFLLETNSYKSCEVVYENIREFLESTKIINPQVVTVAFNLDTLYKENLMQVNKLFDELGAIRSNKNTTPLEIVYNNAKVGMNTFLNSEKGAVPALQFVIASELILLNRNLLTLEIAAQRSGNWLINLTSRDGDWFLDDLLLHSTRAVEMVSNLPPKQDYDENFCKILNGIRIASNIYKGLFELNFNFHTIILPESIKKIHCEEPSVIDMITDLNRVILDVGISIPDMIGQLEKLLTCVLMQMDYDTTYDYVLERVSYTKLQYLTLIPSQSESLSQGKMLLMGFNGLFDKLTQEINNVTNTLGNVDIPKSWKRLDHVKEARNIAPHIFNTQVRSILEDIFFLKRLRSIVEFFSLAQDICKSLKGIGTGIIYNDEQLTKPIKQYIAEFISRKLLGILPEAITYAVCFLLQNLGLDVTHEIEQKDIGAESKVPLDELYSKSWNILLKDGTFSQNVLSQASSLETNLKLAWEKIQEPKKIEQKLNILQSSTLRLQSHLAVHNMMFDEVLQLQNFTSIRAKFIMDIQNEMGTLKNIYRQLVEANNNQQKLIEKADQRLNWAKGANPNVIEISAAFQSAIENRNRQLNLELKIASSILSSYSTILKHEFFRSLSAEPTKEYDKLFLKCFEGWRLSCQYIDAKIDSLTPPEESLLKMLTPEIVNDPKWLHRISEILTDIITVAQKKLKDNRTASFTDNDGLMSLMDNFKTIYNTHCRLYFDVKVLIKSMTKIEDYSIPTQHFLQEYRQYTDNFSMLFSKFKKEINKEEVKELLNHMNYIREHTSAIYEGLLNLESAKKRAQLSRQKAIEIPDKAIPQKQESTSKGQQSNAYAMKVWRRVKMKLEGRDPDPGRKSTVQEQVDYVFHEATNLDNLALLYEGWTPWV
ncbi:serine/threonine-protein kinase Smg1 [Leptinotarsa decemlineata]|uniref:serine/threonine-protein kinase Smg1 n=1 Tax=Leptinotarsa decemlineata TaxID=7539 RepID=UPI003D3077A4